MFAGHRLVRRIARGGMGVVYEAEDERLRRRVALKVVTADDDPAFRRRFVREARLLAEFDHPHVLPVFHAGEEEGLPYLTTRLAEGGSLRGVIDAGPPLPGHALRLLGQLAGALDALHRRGVVHLDVKPENVLLSGPAGDEHVWLADLGLARPVHGTATSSGAVGTVDYMAPEQWRGGGDVGPAADVYAFALVLHETLTGHPLHVLDRGSPLRLGHAPELREVLERALARDPADRPPSAGAVLDEARAAVGARAGPGAAAFPADAGSIAGELLLSGSRGPVDTEVTRHAARTEGARRRTVRWWPALAGVPVAVTALAWAGWSAGTPPVRTPSAVPSAEPSGLTVCARHLTVRRDPRTRTRTRILATLAPGDHFVVLGGRGTGWVYGRSSGSAVATGWALSQWLRPRCA